MNTDRIYQSDDARWYFNVRGNPAKGPFSTYHDAEDALNTHVRQCRRPMGQSSWANPLRSLKIGRRNVSEPRHS